MTKNQITKDAKYDLEDRTNNFGISVIHLCKTIKRDYINENTTKQIVRSSGSIGANYREANESISKKDKLYRLRIARKEAKETIHWCKILNATTSKPEIKNLINEAFELKDILSSIINLIEEKEG